MNVLNCSSWIGREARDCGIQDYFSWCVCDACACTRVFVWACTWDGWRIDSQKPVCWGWSDLFPELHKTFDQFSYSCFKKKKKSFLRNPIIQQRLSPETWIIFILKVVPPSKHSFSYYSFFWWLFDMNKTLSSLLNTCMFGAGIVKVLGWIYFWICKQGSSELPLLAGERMPLPGEPWLCSSVANNLVRS